MSRALLFSGGLDSTSLAVLERPDLGVFINYGQVPASGELRAATAVAKRLDIPLHTVTIDCSSLGSGDMSEAEVSEHAPSSEWWPYRNQLLVTLAAPLALKLGVKELLIGTVSTDSQHADGRIAFVEAIDQLMALQEGRIGVTAPAIGLTSAQLVLNAGIHPSLLAWTHSCHKAGLACGQCRGCYKRAAVFDELGFGLAR